jgi:serine/threonine protein kinase
MIALGRYVLERRLGAGGMGAVWAGRHGTLAVAVKVLHARRGGRLGPYDTFRTELCAMARLSHPGIVRLLDEGVVTETDAAASGHTLEARSPYLVMEQAPGGHVEPLEGRLGWPELQGLLASLLDALAHAHARGVLHRDLKPSNVLRFEDGRVKLSDFGLAAGLGPASDVERTAERRLRVGTPSFMAPEQFEGRWQDYGPPTDLYALGCLAFTLATGDPPFGRGRDFHALAAAHRFARPPPVFARCGAPPGLAGLIERLLAKDPRDRFQHAADAALALRALGAATEARAAPPADRPEETTPAPSSGTTHLRPSPATSGADRSDRTPTLPRRPPAGPGLHWLRATTIVGRETEQARLWSIFERVERERRARLVVVTGIAGSGRTTLARSVAERADELGRAVVLHAAHDPMAGRHHGLEPMLERFFRTAGLGRAQRIAHLRRALGRLGLDESACDDLAYLSGATSPDETLREPMPPLAASERHALIARLLARIAATEPARAVVVVLDDAQWGADALGFARHVLTTEPAAGAPILLVATARADAHPRRPAEARLLSALSLLDAVESLPLGPLAPDAQRALVLGRAPLAPELAARVATHTRESPLFAVQLVGDWLDTGALVARGDALDAPDGGLELAADVGAIWHRRLERLLADASPAAAAGLEIAAVLGQQVDAQEWRAACGVAGADPSPSLVDALLGGGLALAHPSGPEWSWSFAHAAVREALVERARTARRLHAHHEACARMLAGARDAGAAERRARHWFAAGDPHGDAESLLRARARTRAETGDLLLAEALLEEREHALREGRRDDRDPRWGDGWLLRARLLEQYGRLDEAARWVELAACAAARHDWPRVAASADLVAARIARRRGELDEGTAERLARAQARARELGDAALFGECLLEAAAQALARDDPGRAEALARDAERVLLDAAEPARAAGAACVGARAACALGRAGEALERARAARQQAFLTGDRYGVARCLVVMADAALAGGSGAKAADYYERALKRFVAIGAEGPAERCREALARLAPAGPARSP